MGMIQESGSGKPLQIILLYGSFRIFPGTSGARLFMTSAVSEISFDAMSYHIRIEKEEIALLSGISHSVSHVLSPVARMAAIYLSLAAPPFWLRFASGSSPTKFGFLACGAYRVPPGRFPAGFVTVTLYGTSPWDEPLGSVPPSAIGCLALLIGPAQSLPPSQAVRAWTFLWLVPAAARM